MDAHRQFVKSLGSAGNFNGCTGIQLPHKASLFADSRPFDPYCASRSEEKLRSNRDLTQS